MNTTWLCLLLGAAGPSVTTAALRTRPLPGRSLDLFFPRAAKATSGCPAFSPESCDCERFRGRDSAK